MEICFDGYLLVERYGMEVDYCLHMVYTNIYELSWDNQMIVVRGDNIALLRLQSEFWMGFQDSGDRRG